MTGRKLPNNGGYMDHDSMRKDMALKQDTRSLHPTLCSVPPVSRRIFLAGITGTTLGLIGAESREGLLAASKATQMNITSGELKTWRTVKGIEGLEAGLEFLEKADLATLSPGKYEINGDSLFATVSKSPSQAPETRQFESHRKYIDIQCLIAGAELIGVAPADQLKVVSPYNEAKDIAFYSLPKQFENIEMHPGRFVVFVPEHGHMPLCHFNGVHEIHKVVVKMKMDYWKARRMQ